MENKIGQTNNKDEEVNKSKNIISQNKSNQLLILEYQKNINFCILNKTIRKTSQKDLKKEQYSSENSIKKNSINSQNKIEINKEEYKEEIKVNSSISFPDSNNNRAEEQKNNSERKPNSQANQIPLGSKPYQNSVFPQQQSHNNTLHVQKNPSHSNKISIQPRLQRRVPIQPVYNEEYKKYKNISEINHKGIYQPDENIFYITTGCCFKLMPFLLIFFGFLLLMAMYIAMGALMFIYIASYAGAFFCFIGFLLFFIMYNNIYFIMDSNNLIVIKKALCRKKTHIYNPGELIRIDFNHNENNYSLVIVVKNGNNDNIFI